ncbi:MAG: PilZ domain-containing protein [Candidatus Omnitrophica bacterium]|nr:PilZ domain-containing protein [Candidatus Omnitrophota bacterium]
MVKEFLLLASLWGFFLAPFLLLVWGSGVTQKGADLLWQEEMPENPWPNERRLYRRRYLPFPVKYASLDQVDFQEMTLTHDISKGGMRVPSNYPLRPGSRLYLSIGIPKTKPLSLFGEVVWQSPRASAPARFDTGIRFVDLSTSTIMRIARHL